MDIRAVFTPAVVAAVSSIVTLVSLGLERKARGQEAIFKAATVLTVQFLDFHVRNRPAGKTLVIPPHGWLVCEFYRQFEYLMEHGKLPSEDQEKLERWLKEESANQ